MFESYYGLQKTPFSPEIPPSAVFSHQSLSEALARLSYAIERRLICLLTGEVGSGKSLALRKTASELEPARHTMVYLSNPVAGARGVLIDLVESLGQPPDFFRAQLIKQARDVIETEVARGKKLVIVVDEAHLLHPGALEEIRLMTNCQMDSSPRFSLILSGQPPLLRKLRFSTLKALEQRIGLRVRLTSLTLEETSGYIRHHLELAGRPDNLFSDDAVLLVHKSSGGIPREINNLSTQSLLAGCIEKKSIIDESTVRRAIAEIEND